MKSMLPSWLRVILTQGLLFAIIPLGLESSCFGAGVFVFDATSIPPGTGTDLLLKVFGNQTLADAAGPEIETSLNNTFKAMSTTMATEINNKVSTFDFKPTLSAMSNASTLAASGLPVDYATPFKLFSLSVGGGVGVNKDTLATFKNQGAGLGTDAGFPKIGIAPDITMLLGINLHSLVTPQPTNYVDPSRLSVYGSFTSLSSASFPSIAQALHLTFSYKNYGLYGQYKVVLPVDVVPFGILHWGGIDAISGINYTALKLGMGIDMPKSTKATPVAVVGSQESLTAQISYSGKAAMNVDLHSFTIPVEFSTSVQTLYALSVYLGGGLDINTGSSILAINADAPVEVVIINPRTKDTYSIANTKASFDLAAKGSPTFSDIRCFAGAQVNFPLLKIFVQGSMNTTNTLAVYLGARVAW